MLAAHRPGSPVAFAGSNCGEPMASSEPTVKDGSKSPLLWGLPEHLSRDLFKGAISVRLSMDQILFHAGDAGDGCYRVDDGLLKVNMLSLSGNERILCFLGPSAVVGELSMIDGLPRSASVVAVRPATLSFLSRDAFKAFAKKHAELYEYLVILLAGRLRETDAVIAAGSSQARTAPRPGNVADFGAGLRNARLPGTKRANHVAALRFSRTVIVRLFEYGNHTDRRHAGI